MIDLSQINKVYLYPGVTDFRKGLNGLLTLIGNNNIEEGNLYIFCNSKFNSIKIVEIDKQSMWLYQKKLSKNKFLFPGSGSTTLITKNELEILINGASLKERIEPKKVAKIALF